MGRRYACSLDSMNPFRTNVHAQCRSDRQGALLPTNNANNPGASRNPAELESVPPSAISYPEGCRHGDGNCNLAAVDFDKRLSTSTSPRDLRFVDCQGQVRGPAFVEEFKMRVNAWIRVARCHDSCRSRRRQVVVGVVDRLLIESKAACPQPARPFVTQRFVTQREFHWSVAIANHQRYETEGYPILACPCPQILYVTF